MTTRRAFLRGLGALVALPLLPSLNRARAGDTAPLRTVVFFVPNGMPMDRWTPSSTGSSWESTPILSELQAQRSQFTVISGLANRSEVQMDPHPAMLGRSTTGVAPNADGTTGGPSIDQVLAEMSGRSFGSLELASESPVICTLGANDATCPLLWNISWRHDGSPVARETDPRRAFDRIFYGLGAEESGEARLRRQHLKQSVLDAVMDDAVRVQARLSASDRHRLDAYLTSVREVETRLYDAPTYPEGCDGEALEWRTVTPLSNLDDTAHVNAMCEVMTLALQCDRTRVVSYMLGLGQSSRPAGFLGFPDGHHWMSHHGSDPDKLAGIEAVGRWEMAAVARLIDLLSSVDEGEGSLLEHTQLAVFSSISDPDSHSSADLPVLLAGGGCGKLNPGTHVRAEGDLAQLWLTLAQNAGLAIDEFGDATTPLTGL